MKKYIFLIFIVFSSIFSYSQNLSYITIYDSIYPIINENYWKAKDMWIGLEKKYPIDNRERLLFINYSYKNKDMEFFKQQLRNLIINNGFEINEKLFWLNCYNEITSKGKLTKWYEKIHQKYHKKWIIKNIKKLEVINLIEQIYIKDQILVSLYQNKTDTCNALKDINNYIKKECFNNLSAILNISKNYGGLPNAFDYPLSIMGKIEIIILHNLKDSTNMEKNWNLILPYIENAYFDNKISNSSFKMYDKCLYEYFGYQYYGTIKNAPIKDIETYEQRKRKYKL